MEYRNKDMLLNCSLQLLDEKNVEVAAEGFKKYMSTIKAIETEISDHEKLIKAFDAIAAIYFQR